MLIETSAIDSGWPAGAKKPGYRVDLPQAVDAPERCDRGYPAPLALPAWRIPRSNRVHVIRRAVPIRGATSAHGPPPAAVQQGGCRVCGQVRPLGAPIRPRPDA